MINQMNQLSFHLLQQKASKFKKVGKAKKAFDGFRGASKLLRMWLLSWPKLNDRWKTLIIIMKTLRG
jgi:hypothetical protein